MTQVSTLACVDMARADPMTCVDHSKWIAAQIGKPWEKLAVGPFSYDCWGLAGEVERRLYGRELPWAGDLVESSESVREVMDAMRVSALQRSWQPASMPAPGDVVVFTRVLYPAHIGVWVEMPDGSAGILHCERNVGVVFQSLGEARLAWAKVEFRRCVDKPLAAVGDAQRVLLPTLTGAMLVVVNDPLTPLQESDIRQIPIGTSVQAAMDLLGIDTSKRWACLNDMPLLRFNPETNLNEWVETEVKNGDILWVLPHLPEGDDGSQVLAMIVAIVVSIAAPYLAGLILGSGASPFAVKALSAAIALGANALVGQLVQPPAAATDLADPAPTYAFGRLSNAMRPGRNIPRPYGSIKRVPDLLTAPWAQFENNEQMLHLLLCIGLGEHEITEFGIADTKVWSSEEGLTGAIDDVAFEIIQPGGQLGLFPGNVEVNSEVDGIEMLPPDEGEEQTLGPYVAVTSGKRASRLVMDFVFPRGLFGTSGNAPFVNVYDPEPDDVRLAPWAISWTDGTPDPYSESSIATTHEGDFDSTVSSSWVTWLIEGRPIDDQGRPVGFWAVIGAPTFTAASLTAQRFTLSYDVDPGRYEVKATRLSDEVATGSGQEQLVWYGLRAHVASETAIPAVTSLALRVRASAASSAATQQWYVRSTAILPHFDVETGELVKGPTEQIDAAALDVLRADYGMGYDEDVIDLPQLKSLAMKWASRGDVCCTVIEEDSDNWDILQLVLSAGRSMAQMLGPNITFIRDQASSVPGRLITHADMVRGSFEVERLHHGRDKPTVVVMNYRDREGVMRSIDCPGPDVENERRANITTQVMVDRAQVWREGVTIAAGNHWRRVYPSWIMLQDGQSLLRGQHLTVSHPRPSWGYPSKARAVAWPDILLTHPLNADQVGAGWVMLSRPDGSEWGPCKATLLEHGDTLRLDTEDVARILATSPRHLAYDQAPQSWLIGEDTLAVSAGQSEALDGQQVEATRVVFGLGEAQPLACKVVEMLPAEGGTVEVFAVADNPEIYLADLTPVPEETDSWTDLDTIAGPLWDALTIEGVYGVDPDAHVTVAGPVVSGAKAYVLEHGPDLYSEEGAWVEFARSEQPNFSADIPYVTAQFIRSAAEADGFRGPWSYFYLKNATFEPYATAIPMVRIEE